MKLAAAVLVALLAAACSRPSVVPTPEAPTPTLAPVSTAAAAQQAVEGQALPAAVEAATEVVTEPLAAAIEAVDAVAPDAPPPPPVEPLVAAPAVALIVRFEVISPSYYARRLIRPIWPGGASGVTWCIGYDGGHQTESVILEDWPLHAQRIRLAATAGVRGKAAKSVLPKYRDILTPYADCEQVFTYRTLIEYERRTARAFKDGYMDLRPNARGALVSLVYNRGAAMSGDSRREMKHIRDVCVPAQDYGCIAEQIRAMNRLWRGTSIQDGMYARREAEARLTEIN